MIHSTPSRLLLLLAAGLLALAGGSSARAAGLLAPDDRSLPPLRITDHLVDVVIDDGIARTTVTQTFRNETKRRLEATYVFPLPEQADLTNFRMTFNGKMVEGRVLPADEAARIYESIVRQSKDPGLIEFIGRRLLQMRVFPIEPESDTTIEVRYQQICRPVSGMLGYHYPLRTRKTTGQASGTVRFDVALRTQGALKSIWSPTHAVEIVRDGGEHAARIGYEANGGSLEDDFLLLYDTDDRDLGLSVVSHRPSASNPGHFVLMLTPKQLWSDEDRQPQDVVFVLDTSGSMAGDKLEQAKKALGYCIDRLDDADRFSVVRFSTGFDVLHEPLAPADGEHRAAAKAWVNGFNAAGGTNIADTLRHVAGMHAADGGDDARSFVVVFLTDGRGNRKADEIMNVLSDAGADGVRVFPFGVGHDVNTKLLDRLASDFTGRTTYVQPGESLELVLGDFFGVISRPVLTDLRLVLPEIGATERFPAVLGDLYHGQQIIVAGRFTETARGRVTLSARRGGERVEFVWPDVAFDHDEAASYVPGVWAGRKIAWLIDQIRAHGESSEMIAEVLALSQQYGIQTPYSSWLVDPERMRERGIRFSQRPAGGGGSIFGDPGAPSAPPIAGAELGALARRAAPGAAVGDAFEASTKSAGYADGHDRIDLIVAGQNVVAESGRIANLIARKNAALRETDSRDGSRIGAEERTRRELGDRWYHRIGGVLVDATFDATHELTVVRFASPAWFELARLRPDLRPALAAGRAVLVVPAPGVGILVAEDGGIEEFSDEQRKEIGG